MHHDLDERRVGLIERFPVLKYIPPIALIIQYFRTVLFVAGIDGKPVPGTAGVAVPTAEFERHVFEA